MSSLNVFSLSGTQRRAVVIKGQDSISRRYAAGCAHRLVMAVPNSLWFGIRVACVGASTPKCLVAPSVTLVHREASSRLSAGSRERSPRWRSITIRNEWLPGGFTRIFFFSCSFSRMCTERFQCPSLRKRVTTARTTILLETDRDNAIATIRMRFP